MIQIDAPLDKLMESWTDVYQSGQYTEGKYRSALEQAVSERTGMHAVACSSAGAGLFALHKVLRDRHGIWAVQNNTFFATGAMAIEAGHTVALLDCDPRDYAMCPDALASLLSTHQVQGVTLTHVGGGLSTHYGEIAEICASRGVTLFEDAAHAFGVCTRQGVMPGSFGEAAVYSFYPTKAVPAGEGGMVVTRSEEVAAKVREFINYGKRIEGGVVKYRQGFNLRMDEWTAVVLLHQVECLDQILAWRRSSAARLTELIDFPRIACLDGMSNWYKYPVGSGVPAQRKTGKIYAATDQLDAALSEGYSRKFFKVGDMRGCRDIDRQHICLPIADFSQMSDDDVVKYIRG